MNLKDLMVDMKEAWVDYPGFEGFSVEIVNNSREKLLALRKSCLITKFDKARQPYEVLDDKKYLKAFTNATITNWKGLKLEYVEQLLITEMAGYNLEDELPYSQENATLLVGNSGDFDSWFTEAAFDLANFRTGGKGRTVEKAGEVAE